MAQTAKEKEPTPVQQYAYYGFNIANITGTRQYYVRVHIDQNQKTSDPGKLPVARIEILQTQYDEKTKKWGAWKPASADDPISKAVAQAKNYDDFKRARMDLVLKPPKDFSKAGPMKHET